MSLVWRLPCANCKITTKPQAFTARDNKKKKCDRDEMFAIVHPFLVLKGLQFEIRTRASEEIRALTVRLRPLGHPIVVTVASKLPFVTNFHFWVRQVFLFFCCVFVFALLFFSFFCICVVRCCCWEEQRFFLLVLRGRWQVRVSVFVCQVCKE